MKVVSMAAIASNFAKYLKASEKEPVFVTRNGKITAVMEHIEDKDIEDYLLERSPRFRAMLDTVKGEKGGMSLRDYRKARGI